MLKGFDHLAITVADLERCCAFYERLFGLRAVNEKNVGDKVAVRQVIIGGGAKLSIHQANNGLQLVARQPTPGSADFCMTWGDKIETAVALLKKHGITIVDGPSPRRDANENPSLSVYFLDPDGNLVELMAPA